MTREEQLAVWEGEALALLERVREGQAVVGHTERLRLCVMTMETTVDWLRLEQGLALKFPAVKWQPEKQEGTEVTEVQLPQAGEFRHVQLGEFDHLAEEPPCGQ